LCVLMLKTKIIFNYYQVVINPLHRLQNNMQHYIMLIIQNEENNYYSIRETQFASLTSDTTIQIKKVLIGFVSLSLFFFW